MGRHLHFKLGSFYRKDDRTGFPQRAEQTRKEWTGLIVDKARWEARQPQDFVKGVKDDQSVPDARPLPPNQFVGPIYVQLTQDAPVGSTSIEVNSIQGLSNGDPFEVMLGTGEYFRTTISGTPSGSTVNLASPTPAFTPSGNLAVDTAPEPQIFPGGDIPNWA